MQGGEEELFRRAQRGDRAAFDELVRQFNGKVVAVVRCYWSRDADDVVQIVWLAAWNLIENYDRKKAGFGRWLEIIARGKAINERRRRSREKQLIEELAKGPAGALRPGELQEQSIDLEELLADIRACARKLSPRQAQVFHLAYSSEMTNSEIAGVCEIAESRVRGVLAEARKKMARCLARKKRL